MGPAQPQRRSKTATCVDEMSDSLFEPGELDEVYAKLEGWWQAHRKQYDMDSEAPNHPAITEAERQKLSSEFYRVMAGEVHTKLVPLPVSPEVKEERYREAIQAITSFVTNLLESGESS